jgi:signal transduction histidine kinase
VERDLHDGAQVRLAALAMGLGMAKEKLGDGQPVDPGQMASIRDLVGAAHHSAKEALVELRDLARGIHPPVLDAGLADALATLAARSLVPVKLTTDIRERPTPAIEAIAYFCAAELLANVTKHSGANKAEIAALQRGDSLRLRISDDGVGGTDPTSGSGLPGLVQRVRTVDGTLTLNSPEGGPTVVTIDLPLRAQPPA